jgi:hypothetical protein
MMRWLDRVIAWLRQLGFWKLMALAAALLVLWLALQGPSDPSAVNIRRL